MYRVFVEDLEFYAYHGVPAEERKIGHRYRASVILDVDGTAHLTDNVEDTVDYSRVAQAVELVSSSNQFLTVERLAQAVGEALLAHFALAQSVTVKIGKRLPPAEMIAESAGVELTVARAAN